MAAGGADRRTCEAMGRSNRRVRSAVPAESRRLTRAVLGYYLGVIGVVTLVPFQFVVPQQLAWVRVVNVPDFLANILMFVPFGFLYRLSRPVGRREVLRTLARALGVEPEHFREYRIRVITDRLEELPDLVDRLYRRLAE